MRIVMCCLAMMALAACATVDTVATKIAAGVDWLQ
jgi:hypothetical protein